MRRIAAALMMLMLLAPLGARAQQTQCVTNALASGTANAITVPLLPCGTATNVLLLTVTATNTGPVTLQMTGGATLPVVDAQGNALRAGALTAGSVQVLTSTGTSWKLLTSYAGGGGPTPGPVMSVSANMTVTASDVAAGTLYLDVDASGGQITITIPPSLGSSIETPLVVISKVDTSANAVVISDGVHNVDAIAAPAGANGQINGQRDVYSNGTNLRSAGVG
jgi:hypothetical protein